MVIFSTLLMGLGLFGAPPPEIRTIARGTFSGLQEPMQLAVTNQSQWTELWARHSVRNEPRTPAPEIDFSKETILLVTLGQQRTGGYSVEITGVEQQEGKTVVLVSTREPKPGGLNIQVLTAPFHIVAVPKIRGEPAFKEARKPSAN